MTPLEHPFSANIAHYKKAWVSIKIQPAAYHRLILNQPLLYMLQMASEPTGRVAHGIPIRWTVRSVTDRIGRRMLELYWRVRPSKGRFGVMKKILIGLTLVLLVHGIASGWKRLNGRNVGPRYPLRLSCFTLAVLSVVLRQAMLRLAAVKCADLLKE